MRVAACAILCFALGGLRANAQAVRAWEGTLTIPTYKLGPADPNPSFPLVNTPDVYPNTRLDDLTNKSVPSTYQALYLENQYLRIVVLPQLGGHVYSIYDKVNHREVLYRNNVIKYGLVGPRGAWVAGGMEFSFPFAHTMNTVSPVESMIRKNPDGSASILVGAIDWVSNMHWEIALTLHPGTARLQEDVTLFNATPQEHLYLFWTNAAVKATSDLQYIYPMREVIKDDPFAPVQSWPEWNGVDHSWYKNVSGAMAIFGRAVHRDFFGIYYHDSDYGLVHLADYRLDPGKKIWTWGTARSGRIWDKLLSDKDGPYNEIQSGRFYTQGYREFMRPRRVEKWTEYWYPISGLKDGFVDATRQLALNLDYSPDRGCSGIVMVNLSPAAHVSDAVLRFSQGGKVLMEVRAVDLRPLHTMTYNVPVQDLEVAKRTLDVEVLTVAGRQVLHWSAAEPLDGNPNFVTRAGTSLQTEIPDSPKTPTEALYLRGSFLEKSGDLQGALNVYREVLQRDPHYLPALLREAWHSYQAADFAAAKQLITRAVERDQNNPEVQYAEGVIDRAEGRLEPAKDAFWSVIHYGGSEGPALVELGEIEIRERNYLKAEELLKQAVSFNPDDAFALADLSVAERLDGNLQNAAETARKAVDIMPLLPYALAEQLEVERRVAAKSRNELAGEANWKRVTGSDPQNVLAVAAWYHRLGAWRSADEILSAAKTDPTASPIAPMIDYYLASDARQEESSNTAKRYSQEAAQTRTVAVFPNRLEDAAVLSEELESNPADPQAEYELGNFLFAHDRYEEAANLWNKAINAGFSNAVLWRNSGVYEWYVKRDLAKAAEDYTHAIKLSPYEYRLYRDLDEIYEEEGVNASVRAKLFQEAGMRILSHDVVQARYVVFLIEQRRYKEALAILDEHSFTPWEGGVAIHNLYVFASIQSGEEELSDRRPAEAEKYFREAMRYPENLGTGEPPQPITAEPLYWLGNALQAENKRAEAQAAWRDAASQGKNRTDACEVFPALAFERLGEQDEARKLLRRCIELAAQSGATAAELLQAGIAEQYSGNAAQAREDFSRALIADPLYWEARIALNIAQ